MSLLFIRLGLAALATVCAASAWAVRPAVAAPETIPLDSVPYHEDHPVLAYWYGMGKSSHGLTFEDQFRSDVREAQAAGIDGFILMDPEQLETGLRAVRGSDFRLTVHLHPAHDVGSFYACMDDPNLVTYQGRPVMFTWQARTTAPEAWQSLRQ